MSTSWSLTRHGDGEDAVVVAPGGALGLLSIDRSGARGLGSVA